MAKAKELPIDLYRDIIGRLSDPKSVCRFKTVSKSWVSLIAEIKRVELIIASQQSVYSVDLNLDSPSCSSLKVKEHPLPDRRIIANGSGLILRGSCNGLFLFQSFNNMILWRKFIGDFQVITQKPDFRSVPLYWATTALRFLLFGFGYDSANNDYKLVYIMGHYSVLNIPSHYEIKVYSLRNNTWTSRQTSRILTSRIQFDMYQSSQAEFVGNGLHWVAYGDCKWERPPFILAFDLTTEDFHTIELPDKSEATAAGRLGGNLTVTHPKPEFEVDIWVMKEYMVEESWSCLLRISILGNGGTLCSYASMRPLAVCSRNGNTKILLESIDGLRWYDQENDKLDDVDFSPQRLRIINGTAIFLWPTT